MIFKEDQVGGRARVIIDKEHNVVTRLNRNKSWAHQGRSQDFISIQAKGQRRRILVGYRMVGRRHMASAGARAYNWGSGVEPPMMMMMMMMMMRRFVKRVLNSPQRRCQSIKPVALEMSGERQRRERCGSKGSWQTVPDAWAGDRKTPHPQCCRRPWHGVKGRSLP